MRISLLPASVLALSAQGALAGTVAQQARDLATPQDDNWQHVVVAKKECYSGGEYTAPQKYIQRAIDQIRSKEGNARLEQPGCQRIACATKLEITLCYEPVEGSPAVYEKPWSYVADYATGVLEEWCPKTGPYTIMPWKKSWVGGKVWDPVGLAVDIHRMPDDVC